ncbi:Nitrilase/cyanide hydratase and apolipoprotein N-acyltransferase [Niveomyces insectorum RCEF 264]|uniref:Nitrilase/cyanide hydratase and apolipoprotein N-acyltransferase n=1 Tax=Niveomyces insectorum RCEF 264 TaxID=1081102 RepID=A0A167TBW8_9HYPO|nr:Nitrilase/cyanide hydratase and apolipoprotein N-acyltransferase [Niveomyces insectorum RCEF 264]
MKIGCLQFSPHVGDISNNLNRADAVLSKASDLEELDLLVLPELAFTGYNFQSLAEIAPYLEPSGSGISSLWARTTALKYNCNVVVGYPEKSFLFATDEKWALEGQDGFFEGHVPGLGTVAMGICMDINPYKFEAPWHAFEFAFHVLEVHANFVILTMAWLTNENPRSYTRMPSEPDLDMLEYLVQRLEPLIRNDSEDEIIVVFCNRTGIEGDAVYAGTSAVIGVKHGEVNLYGVLGRGVKELLLVDTDKAPFAKIVKSGDAAVDVKDKTDEKAPAQPLATSSCGPADPADPTSPSPSQKDAPSSDVMNRHSPGLVERGEKSPRSVSDGVSDITSVSSVSRLSSKAHPSAIRPMQPKLELQIPDHSIVSAAFRNWKMPGSANKTTPGGAEDIPTPTGPSPTPLSLRPKFVFPAAGSSLSHAHEGIPPSVNRMGGASVVKADRADTPITPPLKSGFYSKKKVRGPPSISEAPPSPPTDDQLGLTKAKADSNKNPAAGSKRPSPPRANKSLPKKFSKRVDSLPTNTTPRAPPKGATSKRAATALAVNTESIADVDTHAPDASDAPGDGEDRDGEDENTDETPEETQERLLKDVQKTLARLIPAQQSESPAIGPTSDDNRAAKHPYVPTRPTSTKSRNASLSRVPDNSRPTDSFGRSISQSRMSIPLVASPSVFRQDPQPYYPWSTDSPIYFRPDSNYRNRSAQRSNQPTPGETRDDERQGRAPMRRLVSPAGRTAPAVPFSQFCKSNDGQDGQDSQEGQENNASFTIAREKIDARRSSIPRPVSRGRQPLPRDDPARGADGTARQSPGPVRDVTEASNRGRRLSSSHLQQSTERAFASNSVLQNRAVSTTSSASWLFGTPPPRTHPPLDPGDEIVAVINLVNRGCPVHTPILAGSTPPTFSQQELDRQHEHQDSQEPQEGKQRREEEEEDEKAASNSSRSRGSSKPPEAPTAEDSVYEVILPPHLRELVESTTPGSHHSLRVLDGIKGRTTPQFNPPTPTAMDFKVNQEKKMPSSA